MFFVSLFTCQISNSLESRGIVLLYIIVRRIVYVNRINRHFYDIAVTGDHLRDTVKPLYNEVLLV